MESKRAVLVIVSALSQNDALYEYARKRAVEEEVSTLLIDYGLSAPAGLAWQRTQPEATLADVLSGHADLPDAVSVCESYNLLHILAGMVTPPLAPVSLAPAVFEAGYNLVLAVTPLSGRYAAEWLEHADALLLACRPEAAANEGVRHTVHKLRQRGITPRLLVDCGDAADADARRQAYTLAAALDLPVHALLQGSTVVSPSDESAPVPDAGERGKSIKQLDDAERRRDEELSEAWDLFYSQSDLEVATTAVEQEPGAVATATRPAFEAEVVARPAQPEQTPEDGAPNRAAVHAAVDDLLEVMERVAALTAKERLLTAKLQRAEQQARALREEPYILDGERINPKFIERLSHLAQVKEEFRQFFVENGMTNLKQQMDERKEAVKRLLGL